MHQSFLLDYLLSIPDHQDDGVEMDVDQIFLMFLVYCVKNFVIFYLLYRYYEHFLLPILKICPTHIIQNPKIKLKRDT